MSGILAKMGNLQLSPGSLFANRFEIQRAAGSGGMGTVYRATDRYSGDTVALKLLHAGGGGSDEAERFLREAQLLSELRHPGIVAHVAHGQTPDGQRFLAMEWLDGQDLGERLVRGPLPVKDCLRLLEQVADALSVAHQRGIIHRDLKPANLFLVGGDVGNVKILDFGIARRIATSQVMTKTGMVVGTPEYMAPEQARGSRDLTPASDLFSLGCVLYECLSGQPPFVADHIAAVLVRILFEEPIPIEERRPGISELLSVLMSRLLCKDPAQRVADAAALRAELLRLGELPEPALGATLAASKPKGESFAEQEQRLFSIVLAAPPEEDIGLGMTQPGSGVQLEATDRRALLHALAGLGGTPDFLANGTLVVTVPPLGSAQDQATVAARAALLIKERWPDAVVSMATGRGAVRGRTAVGEVVELAARALKSGSHPAAGNPTSGVLIDPLSAKLLEGRFAQTPQPGGALLLHQERDIDVSRPLCGKPTPCVGRDAELGNLEGILQSCIEENEARAVVITAPPGVGKSRLRHEFLRRVEKREEPVTVLLGRGDLMNAGAPYDILGQAIRRLCSLSGSESLEKKREHLSSRIAEHLPESEKLRVILFLGELANIPFPAESSVMLPPAREDPRIMQSRIKRAFLDWLNAQCQATPALLVLDDLQWGDALSVGLVNDALREMANLPLFVLALARPEVTEQFPKLWQGHKLQEIALKTLSKKACERLVQQVLGKQVASDVSSRLLEQSGGNALYLEELIRAAAEGRLDEHPETVVAMVQARISRLEPGPRRAVLAASIFGQIFWAGGVTAVLGLNHGSADATQWIAALLQAELVQTSSNSRFANEDEYVFRHALTRDAAYGLLTEQDLGTGHRLAAQFLERAGEQAVATIAEHFEKGGEKARAAELFSCAADQALSALSMDRALKWVERGLACGAEGAVLAALQACAGNAYTLNGRLDLGYPLAATALPHLRPGSRAWVGAIEALLWGAMLGPPEWQAQFPTLTAQLLQNMPDADSATNFAEVLSMPAAFLATMVPQAQLQPFLDHLERVCLAAADREATIMRFFHCAKGHLGWHQSARPWSVLQSAEEGIRLSLLSGDAQTAIRCSVYEGAITWTELGDVDRALELLSEHRRLLADASRMEGFFGQVILHLTLLRWLRGEPGSEAALLEAAGDVRRNNGGMTFIVGLGHDLESRVLLSTGQLAAAEVQAHNACRVLEATPCFHPNCYATLLQCQMAQHKFLDAVDTAERALAVIRQFGCVGYAEVETRLAISEAFFASGNRDRAQTELRETLRQIQLRTDDIPDPFWKNSYLTRNPYCVRAQALAKEWGLDAVVR